MDEPEVRFFKGFSKANQGAQAIALVYGNEIHVDSQYKDSPELDKILWHEEQHFLHWQKYKDRPLRRHLETVKFHLFVDSRPGLRFLFWSAILLFVVRFWLTLRGFFA